LERCLACEADAVDTRGEPLLPGPRLHAHSRNPAFTNWACASRRLPRTSPDVPTTHRDSLRFLPMQHDKPDLIVGRFREPPARQCLRNTTVVCTIRSGCGQPSKAAPLGCRPRSASQARQRSTVPSPITSHQSHLTSHASVASTALRSAFSSPGVNSIAPAFALAIACSPLRAPTRACVQPGCDTVQAITT
jgi:hypothetical protein